MSITRRVTANYSRRRKAARIRNQSQNWSDRVEIARYELPVDRPIERAAEPLSDLVAESRPLEIRSDRAPRRSRAVRAERLDTARAQAERMLKEHVQYDEYGTPRCVLCGFKYPCDAVSVAEDLLALCVRADAAEMSLDAEPTEYLATPN